MARPLKVVHVGLGPIGQGIARLVPETDGLQIVGATDPFPDHAGKDLGALLGLPRRLRVRVEGNPERSCRRWRADVGILHTSSAVQRKVVAIVNLDLVDRAMTEVIVRHVRVGDTVDIIAEPLGWQPDRVEETADPAIVPRAPDTEYLRIPAGAVAGIKHVARGYH